MIDKGASTSWEIVLTNLVVNTDASAQPWVLISVF